MYILKLKMKVQKYEICINWSMISPQRVKKVPFLPVNLLT